MQNQITKRPLIITLILTLSLALCAYSAKFTCDLCKNTSRGKKYDLTFVGRGYVCEDCYDWLYGQSHRNKNFTIRPVNAD